MAELQALPLLRFNRISLRVDNEIKADVFDKMLSTDWEPLTSYHTGDLLTRWSADASAISGGILSWIPNLIIYTVRFISTFVLVLYYDPTFALLAILGIPVSIFMSRTLLNRMQSNNMRSVKPDATDEEIISALSLACAWDFVKKLPDGINSRIQERGGGFSASQSQRLSIAHALLRKSPVLLLDEATSALDVATERRVLKNILTDEYPRTCIVTTHRPTVLNICQKVYAIRDRQCALLTGEEIAAIAQDF